MADIFKLALTLAAVTQSPSLARSGAHLNPPPPSLLYSFSLPLSSGFPVMSARVFRTDELAARIATHLQAISRKSTISLALTCRTLEVPALRSLWEALPCVELKPIIIRLLPGDTCSFIFPRGKDLCLLVSLLISSGGHSTYSPIVKKTCLTGVAASAYTAGVE